MKNMKQYLTSNLISAVIRVCILAIFTVCVYLGANIKNSADGSGNAKERLTRVFRVGAKIVSNNMITKDDQLETLYNNREQWEVVDGIYKSGGEEIYFDRGYSYAITDMDDDGKLEILMSGMSGSKRSSINVFYEFKNIDEIEKMDTSNLNFEGSEPDIKKSNYLCASIYRKPYIYWFSDYIYYGAGKSRTNYYTVTVKNNIFSTRLSRYMERNGNEVYCYDGEGTRISLNDFNMYNLWDYYDVYKTIGWFQDVTMDNLKASYDGIEDYSNKTYEERKAFVDVPFEDVQVKSASKLNETFGNNISITVDDSLLDYSDIDEETKNLYREFLKGQVSATVKDTYIDDSFWNWFSDDFHKGNSYNIQQIIEQGYEAQNEEYKGTIGRYMDCGLDGNYEMQVELCFSRSSNFLVIKNIGGKLYICYVGENWERRSVIYGENGYCGYISRGGSYHEGTEYYIDADGKINFYRKFAYEGVECIDLPDAYSEMDLDIHVSFVKVTEDASEPWYVYGIEIYNDDEHELIERNDETECLFEAVENDYRESGYIPISDERAYEIQKEARESIGLTEEVYHAEVNNYSHD